MKKLLLVAVTATFTLSTGIASAQAYNPDCPTNATFAALGYETESNLLATIEDPAEVSPAVLIADEGDSKIVLPDYASVVDWGTSFGADMTYAWRAAVEHFHRGTNVHIDLVRIVFDENFSPTAKTIFVNFAAATQDGTIAVLPWDEAGLYLSDDGEEKAVRTRLTQTAGLYPIPMISDAASVNQVAFSEEPMKPLVILAYVDPGDPLSGVTDGALEN